MSWTQIFLRFAIRTHQKNELHKLLIERPISINRSLHQLELFAFNFKIAPFANNSKKNCYKQISFTFSVSSANFTSAAKAMPVSLKKKYNFFSLQIFFFAYANWIPKCLSAKFDVRRVFILPRLANQWPRRSGSSNGGYIIWYSFIFFFSSIYFVRVIFSYLGVRFWRRRRALCAPSAPNGSLAVSLTLNF